MGATLDIGGAGNTGSHAVQQFDERRERLHVSNFDDARDESTRADLAQLPQIMRGNVTRAARLAGRNRTDFYELLNRHEVQPDEFKQR